MKKLQIDQEIRNPMLDAPNVRTLEYVSPPGVVIVQPSNREIALKINEIIDWIESKKDQLL